ncbi:MAG TPA: 1,4-alpha-glucan branching protein GlgB [Rudaea sp.]|nr:1,4-alpha-glucan branching protein GlgB [Rudaea sp.]
MKRASPVETVAGDPAAVDALIAGRNADPFALLGPHEAGGARIVRAFLPGAEAVEAIPRGGSNVGTALERMRPEGYFCGRVTGSGGYRLRVHWPGSIVEFDDPYAFGPLLGDLDLHLIGEGTHRELGDVLGAHVMTIDGVAGTRFAVWAPNARRVSVVGDFNAWDGRRHPMRQRHDAGVWEIFLPGVGAGERYKYEILGVYGELLPLKADPCGREAEMPPATASIVPSPAPFEWSDSHWLEERTARQAADAPIAIYEIHASSWLRCGGHASVWQMLAERLVPYLRALGFTHVELMPIMQHPFTGSWGYQPLGQFAPAAQYGSPAEFAAFVDRCHAEGIGVILDWVPAHFPTDAHGLARFDGTALYEHADPREGYHPDWHTYVYNFGRNEVRGFLIASALEWIERFHADALRVDAVASMLYRDYSRRHGEWIPNVHGGRENYEAIHFLRELNATLRARGHGAHAIAEESTAWPGVSRPPEQGGLGFGYKWNMGWMHDTLRYFARDPIHRSWHHDDITFGLLYAFSENFVLPLSHDEVVHGKRSLLGKMAGDRWQRFANLRACFALMWAHPGKKLLFMGGEIAELHEWNHDGEIDWGLLNDPLHAGMQRLVGDLNRLYRSEPALHRRDAHADGFAWIVGDDRASSVFAFLRRDGGDPEMLVVANLTPMPHWGYRIGVPRGGRWREMLNSDAALYGGSNLGNAGSVEASTQGAHGHAHSLVLTLPPLGVLYLRSDA